MRHITGATLFLILSMLSLTAHAVPPVNQPLESCYLDCLDDCGNTNACRTHCKQKCTPPPPPHCWDEPDPNYKTCMGGIWSWEIGCFIDTAPLAVAWLVACAAEAATDPENGDCEIVLNHYPCHLAAEKLRESCTPTRHACD